MNKSVLDRVNILAKQIRELEGFVHTYELTWKRGTLSKRGKKLFVGHLGYGYFSDSEIEADKELSEKIYQTVVEHLNEKKLEFERLGGTE